MIPWENEHGTDMRGEPDGGRAGGERQAVLAERAALLRHRLVRDPSDCEAWGILGSCLGQLRLLDAAAVALGRAVRLCPDRIDPAVAANLGAVALRRGRPAEALARFDALLAADPDHADARWNRALARLTLGDLAGGFLDAASRWRAWDLPEPFPDSPRWDGQPLDGPLDGTGDSGDEGARTLLLVTEQGRGDILHFVRYCAAARIRAGRVVLACPPDLGELLASVPGLDGLVPLGAPPPPHASVLPLMDLPAVLGLRGGPLTGAVPYLQPDEERLAIWRGRLRQIAPTGLRVGVAWRGSPTHHLDAERSLPLEALRRLADVPGVTLVALHPDGRTDAEQVARAAVGLVDPEPDADWKAAAFSGSAALIAALDLVVSVDTVFAHLTGALACPGIVLLPPVPDWRWGLEGAQTPWYPTLRLERAAPGAGWDDVLDRVAALLAEAAAAVSADDASEDE